MKAEETVSGRNLIVKFALLVIALATSPAIYASVLGFFDVSIGYWLAFAVILTTRLSVGTGVSQLAAAMNKKTDSSQHILVLWTGTIVSYIGSSVVGTVMLSFLGIDATVLSVFAAQAAVIALNLITGAVSSRVNAFVADKN